MRYIVARHRIYVQNVSSGAERKRWAPTTVTGAEGNRPQVSGKGCQAMVDFKPISIRGRIAYGIMCAESYVLSKYPDRD